MLSVTFLGTSAARPTVERNVSGLALERDGETILFECGEGTQRQMMRYGVSFALSEIFFTHFHADHFLGVIGLIRTLGLQARAEPMRLYGPKGAKRLLGQALQLGVEASRAVVLPERIPYRSAAVLRGEDLDVVPVALGAAHATDHGAGLHLLDDLADGRVERHAQRRRSNIIDVEFQALVVRPQHLFPSLLLYRIDRRRHRMAEEIEIERARSDRANRRNSLAQPLRAEQRSRQRAETASA